MPPTSPRSPKKRSARRLHALRPPAADTPGNRTAVDLDVRNLSEEDVRLRNESLESFHRPERWVPITYVYHPVSKNFIP